jgi:hypothetical protein
VAYVATGPFKIVASIYKPFSVKALGSFIFPHFIEFENFVFNCSHSVSGTSMIPVPRSGQPWRTMFNLSFSNSRAGCLLWVKEFC